MFNESFPCIQLFIVTLYTFPFISVLFVCLFVFGFWCVFFLGGGGIGIKMSRNHFEDAAVICLFLLLCIYTKQGM